MAAPQKFLGFWSDGDTYRANGTRYVKFDTPDHNIPTEGTGFTNIGNIFWTAAIQTMVIFKLSCYI
jgi:hypothetical protein